MVRCKPVLWLLMATLLIIVPLVAACAAPAEEPTLPPPPTKEEPVPTPPAATPTAIPHTLEGRADCLMCHETGLGEATKIPVDHSGRTNDTCTTCHKPAA